MRAATEALRETVLRLLRAGEVHPQLIVGPVTTKLCKTAIDPRVSVTVRRGLIF
jgi:hypothetical protein